MAHLLRLHTTTYYYETTTGLETWFEVPNLKSAVVAPPKWKMAIVVFVAAYAISLISRLHVLLILRIKR